MPHSFFDSPEYPWSRPEAVALHRALYRAFPDPRRIELLYRRSGEGLRPLSLSSAPDLMWKEALEQLTVARRLQQFCDIVLRDPSLAAIHPMVQGVIESTDLPSVASVEQPIKLERRTDQSFSEWRAARRDASSRPAWDRSGERTNERAGRQPFRISSRA